MADSAVQPVRRHPRPAARGRNPARGGPSWESLLRKELDAKRVVHIDGEPCRLAMSQLVIRTTVMDALTGDRHARRMIWDAMDRLYPPQGPATPPSCRQLNASDALTIAEFEADLRRRIRQEGGSGAEPARRRTAAECDGR